MNEIKELLTEIVGLLTHQNVNGKEILGVEEAAIVLNVSKSYIYKLTQKRELPYFCPAGKKYYFRREDLLAYLTRYRTATELELEKQANEYLNRKRR